MSGWVQVVVAVVIVALPIALMLAFNRDNVSDARGRRIFSRWHT